MMEKSLILIIYLLIFQDLFSKVLIFTHAYNRPDFIEIQYKTFKKFLEDDYEFIVFNDAHDTSKRISIEQVCKKYNITCIRIPQEIHELPYLDRKSDSYYANYHKPSVRNSNVVQYSLDKYGFKHNGIVVIMDSDLFLIKNFNFEKFLQGYDIAGYLKSCQCRHLGGCNKIHPNKPKTNYLWIGLMLLDLRKMLNKESFNVNCGAVFDQGIKRRVDAGGFTYYYMKNNPQLKLNKIRLTNYIDCMCKTCKLNGVVCVHNTDQLLKLGLRSEIIKFIQSLNIKDSDRYPELYLDDTFLHFRGGTYTMHMQSYEPKNQALQKLIDNILTF